MSNRIIVLFLVLLFIYSCKEEQNVVVQFCPEEFEAEAQVNIGNAVLEAIANNPVEFPILDVATYPDAYEYVNQLFFSMVHTPPMATNLPIYDWQVNIVNKDDLRTAYFVPGGQFYVTTGLLQYIEAEHQLLSVIAHELYYVNTDLIPKTIKEEEVIDCFLLGDLTLARTVPEASQIAMALPTLSFSADLVLEADSFALDLLCPFLYEPLGLREIIIKASEDDEVLHWLEYRMANVNERINAIERVAADCQPGGVRNEEMYQKFKTDWLP